MTAINQVIQPKKIESPKDRDMIEVEILEEDSTVSITWACWEVKKAQTMHIFWGEIMYTACNMRYVDDYNEQYQVEDGKWWELQDWWDQVADYKTKEDILRMIVAKQVIGEKYRYPNSSRFAA